MADLDGPLAAEPPPPRPRNTDPQAHRELIAVKAWRDQAVQQGHVAFGSIKDTDLTRIVTHGRRDVRPIAAILSEANRHLAEEIVEVLVAAAESTARVDRPVTSTGPSGSSKSAADPVTVSFAPTRNVGRASPLGLVRISETGGRLRLSWSPPPDPDRVVVYRVVSRDDRPPGSPANGTLIAVGSESTALDERPITQAARCFSVFANGGYTEEEAYGAQPQLIASGTFYFSIQDLDWLAEEGQLSLRWRPLAGMVDVRVYRVPVEIADDPMAAHQRHEVDPGRRHIDGLLDTDPTPGATYRYEFEPQIEMIEGGERRVVSASARFEDITIPAPLMAVQDLRATRRLRRDGSLRFDLSWTRPPAGTVMIFCSPSPPNPGAQDGAHDEGALGTSLGLDLAHVVGGHIENLDDGRTSIESVKPTDPTWRRIHFTPVTRLGGRIVIGNTSVEVVIDAPVQLDVVERCDYQALKFGWPRGAAKVVALVRRLDAPAEPITAVQTWSAEIDLESWTDLGSLQLRHRLPAEGCRIDAVGIAYDSGGDEFGPTVSVKYPGLTRLQYDLSPVQKGIARKRTVALIITLRAERSLVPISAFSLVYQRDRLPLHPGDGEVLLVEPDTYEVGRPVPEFTPAQLDTQFSTTGWRADVDGRTGFVRLFALGDERIALLDPPPQKLVLT